MLYCIYGRDSFDSIGHPHSGLLEFDLKDGKPLLHLALLNWFDDPVSIYASDNTKFSFLKRQHENTMALQIQFLLVNCLMQLEP